MKRILFLFIMFSVAILHAYSINMKVGETRTLSFVAPPNLSKCKWNISRPECIQIAGAVYATSTSIDIKAIKATPPATYCLVQCEYNYNELDPSGKYIYGRTGSKEWRILIEGTDSGGGSGGGGTGGGTTQHGFELNYSEITLDQGQKSPDIFGTWSEIENFNFNWKTYDNSIASPDIDYGKQCCVFGNEPGTTYLFATNAQGYSKTVKITVNPKTYNVGDMFLGLSADSEKSYLKYKVLNLEDKTCSVSLGDRIYTNITIPSKVMGYTVTEIADECFFLRTLQSIALPSGLKKIGKGAFRSTKGLKSIKIPNSVELIENNAFNSCADLETISLPSNLETLGYCAFLNCANLETISLPSTLEIINLSTFEGASKLKTINFPKVLKTIGNSAFSGTALEKIYLEEGLDSIGYKAFENVPCKELILPSTLKSISFSAFSTKNDFSYTSITSKISQPFSISSYVFNDATYQNAVLIVPASSKHLYETTPGWNKFQHIEGHGASGSDDDMVETVLYEGLNEDDATCDWTFETFDVDDDYYFIPSDKEVWKWAAYNGKHYLVGNAHEFTAPFNINSYAFSPAIKVNKLRKFRISFDHAAKYQESGFFNLYTPVSLHYADREGKDYVGWLCNGDIPTIPTPGTWAFVNSGEIELEIDGSNADVESVRICLYYHGDSKDGANAWEIRNIKMVGIGPASAIEEVIVDAPEANYPTEVYNLSGIKVAESTDNLPAGIYIVRRGPSAQKIAIR